MSIKLKLLILITLTAFFMARENKTRGKAKTTYLSKKGEREWTKR